MIDTLEPQWIWQAKAWPNFHPDPQVLAGPLARARLAQGQLMGKAEAVGAAGFVGTRQEIWTGEALATAEIEGEQLNVDAVRSSVARRPNAHGN